MDKKIKDHFYQNDPVLFNVLKKLEAFTSELVPTISSDYFSSLCETIINQQLSEKAGHTIHSRFLNLFSESEPTPQAVEKLKEDQLRGVGMSGSKARFIQKLGVSVLTKQIDFVVLIQMSDEKVISELMKLHGIGRWSAEMFLMFSLGRPDVFSYGDAGLRRAMQNEYGKNLTEKQIRAIVEKWSPYKTYACRILWKSLDFKKSNILI